MPNCGYQAGSRRSVSCAAGSEGFSTKRVIRWSASICMMPNPGTSARRTGIVAIVMSAPVS